MSGINLHVCTELAIQILHLKIDILIFETIVVVPSFVVSSMELKISLNCTTKFKYMPFMGTLHVYTCLAQQSTHWFLFFIFNHIHVWISDLYMERKMREIIHHLAWMWSFDSSAGKLRLNILKESRFVIWILIYNQFSMHVVCYIKATKILISG